MIGGVENRDGFSALAVTVQLPHNGGHATVEVSEEHGFVIVPDDLDPDLEVLTAALTDNSRNNPTAALFVLRDAFEAGVFGVEEADGVLASAFNVPLDVTFEELAASVRYEIPQGVLELSDAEYFALPDDEVLPREAGRLFNDEQIQVLQVIMALVDPLGDHGIATSAVADPAVLVWLWRAGHRDAVRSDRFPVQVLVDECLTGDRRSEVISMIDGTAWIDDDAVAAACLGDHDSKTEQIVARTSPFKVHGSFEPARKWSPASRVAAIEGLFAGVTLQNEPKFDWDRALAHARTLARTVTTVDDPFTTTPLVLSALGPFSGSAALAEMLAGPPFQIGRLDALRQALNAPGIDDRSGSWAANEHRTWMQVCDWARTHPGDADGLFERIVGCPTERLFPMSGPGEDEEDAWRFDLFAPAWGPVLVSLVMARLSDDRHVPLIAEWFCRAVPPAGWYNSTASRWLTVDIPYFLHWRLGLVTELPWWMQRSSKDVQSFCPPAPWTYWARVLPPVLATSILSGDPGEGHEPF